MEHVIIPCLVFVTTVVGVVIGVLLILDAFSEVDSRWEDSKVYSKKGR